MPKHSSTPAGKQGRGTTPRARAGSASVGSRSPKHRGYRPAEGGAATGGKKPRWSREQRQSAGLPGERRDARERREAREERPAAAPRGERPYGAQSRGPRGAAGSAWGAGERRGGQHLGSRRSDDRGAAAGARGGRSRGGAGEHTAWPAREERGPNDWYPRDRREQERGRPQRAGGDGPRRDGGRADAPNRAFRDRRDGFRPARGDDRAESRGAGAAPRGFDADRGRTGGARPRFDDDRRREAGPRSWDDRRSDRAPRSQGERQFRGTGERREHGGAPRGFEQPARQAFVEDVVLERLEAQQVAVDTDVEGGFAELGLGSNIVATLAELGADRPFPIQAATIPEALAGRDVLGRGRTGSGKTIAFGAPLVERILRSGKGGRREVGRAPRALILAPTRELALQIDATVQPIAQSVGLFTTQIYGGVPQARQVGALRRGVDIIIGTPGRIEDLVAQGRLDLSEIQVTVLDEADHMCDLGFLEPVQRILDLTADGGQRLLFSATLDKGVATLVERYLQDPAVYEVAGEDQASATIEHRVFVVDQREKAAIVEELAAREGKTLIFARTRAFAEQLTEQLEDADIRAVSLHGDLNQARRSRNLERLTSGRVRVLVATDVAARGIHVDDIELVVQADIPDEYKTYLHRAGRTGRAGREGTVVTLVTRQRLRKLNELLGRAEIAVEPEYVRAGSLPEIA